jgi:hypothetical protein
MRLKIAKLAASPVHPLEVKPTFQNELLQDQDWTQDVKWLRDTYNDIAVLWEEMKAPEQDEMLFTQTEPKLRELVLSLLDVVPQVPWMPIVKRYMTNARHDFEISVMYAHSGDYASAVLYQSYSLVKIHTVLENLTRTASQPTRNRFSSFNEKKAYGYDISGEVFEGSGEMANRENQKNIDDTAQPQDHHETPPNPANLMHDTDADKEFPELEEFKNKRVIWPPRTR